MQMAQISGPFLLQRLQGEVYARRFKGLVLQLS